MIALEVAVRGNDPVEMRGETQKGVRMWRCRRERGKESAEIIQDHVVEPSTGGEGVEKIRGCKRPELSIVFEGDDEGSWVRLKEGAEPGSVGGLGDYSEPHGGKYRCFESQTGVVAYPSGGGRRLRGTEVSGEEGVALAGGERR